MELEIPPEPTLVKEQIVRGLKANRELQIASLKQATWIASPLWSDFGWGRELKKHNLTWQKFMVIVRDHYPYFLDWVMGRMSWSDVMVKLVERIEDEVVAIKKSQSGS